MTRRFWWFLGVGTLGLVIGAKGMEWYIANYRACATSIVSQDGSIHCSCRQYSITFGALSEAEVSKIVMKGNVTVKREASKP